MVLGAIAIPTMQSLQDRDAARSAARYLANRLGVARIEALRRNTNVSLRFDPEDIGRTRLFADGDGDGVRQADIDDGIDFALGPAVHITELFRNVSLRIPSAVPAPDDGGTLDARSDPIRIGSSNLLSFSPLGSATSGTIYLAARTGPQLCVRVLGATGRTRVLWFDTANQSWRHD